jgi:hypothetical protein
VGLGETTAGPHAEGGDEVDHVGDLGELGQLGPDLEGHAREALGDEAREIFGGLVDEGRAGETAERGRRDAAIDGPREPFLRVDVPARAALEPSALRRREAARIAGALEARLHEHLRAVLGELEIEAGAERLVAEPELHHLRLEDDPTPLEEREEIGRVLAADLDPDAPRAVVLEAREHPQGVTVACGRLGLGGHELAREERGPCVGIEHGHGERGRPHLDAVLDALRGLGHRVGEPRVDAGRDTPVARGVVRTTGHLPRGRVRGDGLPLLRELEGTRGPTLGPAALPLTRERLGRGTIRRRRTAALRDRRREPWLSRRGPFLTALAGPHVVPESDEERGDMLAVSMYFRERGARALGVEAVGDQAEPYPVRLGLGPANDAARGGLFDLRVRDGPPAYVVVPAKEGPGAEEATEGTVVECGERFREWGGHAGRSRAQTRRALSRSGPAEAEPDVRHGHYGSRPGRCGHTTRRTSDQCLRDHGIGCPEGSMLQVSTREPSTAKYRNVATVGVTVTSCAPSSVLKRTWLAGWVAPNACVLWPP